MLFGDLCANLLWGKIMAAVHFSKRSAQQVPCMPLNVQPGAVKLVFWHHWMHLNLMHPVTSENQFHCIRL